MRDRPERQVTAVAADVGLLEFGLRIEIRVVAIGRLGDANRAGLDVGLDMTGEIGDVDMAVGGVLKSPKSLLEKTMWPPATRGSSSTVNGVLPLSGLVSSCTVSDGAVVDVNMADFLLVGKAGLTEPCVRP